MHRSLCVPGVFLLFSATVLLICVSISLPAFTGTDITRVHFSSGSPTTGSVVMSQLRFGIWAYCYDDTHGARTCIDGRAYSLQVHASSNGQNSVTIESSWTRGLAVHPVAAAVSFIAFLLALSNHIAVELFAFVVAFVAALITLIAFAIDIALFVFVKNKMNDLAIGAHTIAGPGFWITFVAFFLLILGGCTVCFGHRKNRSGSRYAANDNTYAMKRPWYSRFRRNV